jgi:hypothetical protein
MNRKSSRIGVWTCLIGMAAVAAVSAQEPRFESFSSPLAKRGPGKSPRLVTAGQRQFGTQIREGVKNGANFGGHYSLVQWGCGAGCVQMVLADLESGALYDGPFGALPGGRLAISAGAPNAGLEFRAASRLLLVNGCPNEKDCGRYAYEWDGRKFRELPNQVAAAQPYVPLPAQTGASLWNLSRRVVAGETDINPAIMSEAREKTARMPRVALTRGGRARAAESGQGWTNVGPGNVGSRTRSLLIDPRNPEVLYTGAVSGGVWKTTDGGRTWFPLWDAAANLIVGALAMDPNDPDTIYAGGGEQFDSRVGAGIFRSTDGGANWAVLRGTTGFSYVNRIVVSPNNPLQIYAATRTGIAATKDGGNTWTMSALNSTYYGCVDLVIRSDAKVDSLFAYCSAANSTTPFAVWRNTDAAGGGTWTQVYTGANMGRGVISLAPSRQSTVYVAAAGLGSPASARDGVGLAGVFRSTENGDPGSWTTQVSGSSSNPFHFLLFAAANATAFCANGTAVTNTGGSWAKMIAVDPLDANRVWVGGLDLFRSDDGGLNWGVASEWIPRDIPPYSHGDRHGIYFHPAYDGTSNQVAYQATDGGVFRTDNARAAVSTGARAGCVADYMRNSKVFWTELNGSFATTQFYHGAVYPGGSVFLGGAQDTGVNRGVEGAPDKWSFLVGGDGASVAVDPFDTTRLLISSQNLSLLRSTDGGSFTSGTQTITDVSADFPFIAPLAIDPNEPNNVYLGSNKNLWRSNNWAASWTIGKATGQDGAVRAIAVSPFDSNVVLFGTAQGYIYRTSNALDAGGGAYSKTRPRAATVASIAFDPSDPRVVYVTYSNLKGANSTLAHVYKSTDGGATFTPSDGSGTAAVPDVPVSRLLVNPKDPLTLYLGTDVGLMVSHDGGLSWGKDTGLPNVIVEDLSFDSPTATYLFAFTYGRSVYRIALPGAPEDCRAQISPDSIEAGVEGGTFAVNVTVADGCIWHSLPGSRSGRFAPQSPGQGTGTGKAFVTIPPNLAGPAASETMTVAGQPLPVKQAAATFTSSGADARANAPLLTIPRMTRTTIRTLTSAADDPVLSCTGSAGFATLWWRVQPAADGFLDVGIRGDRLDGFGGSGLALAVYAADDPGVELGCLSTPRSTTSRELSFLTVPVQAGKTYLIETAATTADGANANVNLIVRPGIAPPVVELAAPAASIAAGAGPQTFTATIAGPENQALRWSLSPAVGILSQRGVYTPPAKVDAPREVTITATPFADPRRAVSVTITVTP